ncbi:hypothetical protein [Rhizobium tumorigenes]|uniref:hypothetical protein n=1 Tax=Rhizobium tumorigenes TaxID=2041385 RepID=UPI00241DD5AA|nr:hypothetical protein [Rhizobium tumorigenes]WFS01564.1 hypothetical protein PR016_02720 [Rhizobium tumorigenes]
MESHKETPDLSGHPRPETIRQGIYIASKTKHAERWRALRAAGLPIISTWIDEAGQGESGDLNDLWRRCILEASTASALVIYREPEDVLKGGWIELGAALASGVPIYAVGIEEFTIASDKRIRHFAELDDAFAATFDSAAPTPQTRMWPDLPAIAAKIQALTLHPATSQEYDAGYIAARNDAFAIVQEEIDNAQ